MGWYHLFYQYNPNFSVWGDITWGHAISMDLIHWYHLPLAMARGNSSDKDSVYIGYATHLPDGRIVMLYTGKIGKPGKSKNQKQVQNLAYPANLSDPALCDWFKYEGNPVLKPPPEIDQDDFRDPTTAWLGPDGTWQVAIGAKYHNDDDTCVFLVYQTTDFISYLLKRILHEVRGLGMWPGMLRRYPISMIESGGLDNSATSPGIKHVLKAQGIKMMRRTRMITMH
ncbi:hypothetical protein L1049_019422 [Liquidambar formosana]|uniref:Glycosyl hydrolase family 32 N-terminal domain-containing protein n=1 Tax=Liquidambar formosana TaxID=63359 RepID=A0AAP0X313_LIQFO